jgi:hypothetical protein
MTTLNNERLLQDWVTLGGLSSTGPYRQDPCCIPDTLGFIRCKLHAIVSDAGSSGQLFIEGATSLDGPWMPVLTVNPTAGTPGEFFYDLECDGSATLMLYRYLRWRVAGSGTDTMCFTIAGTFE